MYSWKALILVVNAITSENRVVLSFSFMGMDEQQRGFGSFYWSEFWQNKGREVHFWFFFSSFLMWKIQLLIWRDFIILKKMRMRYELQGQVVWLEKEEVFNLDEVYIYIIFFWIGKLVRCCAKVWVGTLWAWDFCGLLHSQLLLCATIWGSRKRKHKGEKQGHWDWT